LGPHVIGTRVVVRRIVPGARGATGGLALTDVLGICTSWPDPALGPEAEVTIETDAGPVSFPAGLVVSGKPVPPRPSVRLRVGVREAELHTAGLFPGVEATPLGEWSIRWEPQPEGRLRKRANSALAVGSPGGPLTDGFASVATFYRERGRTPLLHVELDGDVEAAAVEAGWAPVPGDTAFLVASVAQLSRRLPEPELPVVVDGPEVHVETGTATGRAALDGDWVGLHDLAVDPAHRRQGLAGRVIASLLDVAAEQGVRTAWLHVELDNSGARALYDGLGFAEHHRMRYLTLA